MKINWIDINTIKLVIGEREIIVSGNYGEGCGIFMEVPGQPDVDVNSQDNNYTGFATIELKDSDEPCNHILEEHFPSGEGFATSWCKRCGRLVVGDGKVLTPSMSPRDIVPESEVMESGQLATSECYINALNGDLYIVNWPVNRPVGNEWVRISRACWTLLQ